MLLSVWSEKKTERREQREPRNGTEGGEEECARKIEYEPAWQGYDKGCVVAAAKFSCNPRYDVSPGLDF